LAGPKYDHTVSADCSQFRANRFVEKLQKALDLISRSPCASLHHDFSHWTLRWLKEIIDSDYVDLGLRFQLVQQRSRKDGVFETEKT
jgi:hypothetical protein